MTNTTTKSIEFSGDLKDMRLAIADGIQFASYVRINPRTLTTKIEWYCEEECDVHDLVDPAIFDYYGLELISISNGEKL